MLGLDFIHIHILRPLPCVFLSVSAHRCKSKQHCSLTGIIYRNDEQCQALYITKTQQNGIHVVYVHAKAR